MVDKYLIPRANAPFVDAAGHPTREWYNWLRALNVLFESSDANVQAEIEAIARALGSPDGSVEKIPPQDSAEVGKVIGINSVATYGVLPNVVQVQLLGDVATADPTSYYGSDDVGNKGWHPMVGAFATTTLALTSGATTGVVSFDLADLADSGTGTFKIITRDAKGRVSGTADGTTNDVPEGDENLYFTDARAQAAVVVSGITDGDTTHSPSGDAVFDALAGKEPTITAGTTAQYWRGDKTWQTLNKAAVGLGNVDNTSDADKPVSTAQQAALDVVVPPGYIDGLVMQWVSSTAMTVTSGAAFVPGAGTIVRAGSDIALTGLSLTANRMYHAYLYDNSGTPDIELSLTAPVAYNGTARIKTGDDSRRYVGSILVAAGGAIQKFTAVTPTHIVYLENVFSALYTAVSNGNATASTTVSLTPWMPVTARSADLAVQNTDASRVVDITNPDALAQLLFVLAQSAVIFAAATDASQNIKYKFRSAPTGGLYVFVLGYEYMR